MFSTKLSAPAALDLLEYSPQLQQVPFNANTLVTLNWSITVIVFLNSQVTLSSSTSLDRIALERLLAGGSLLQVNPQLR